MAQYDPTTALIVVDVQHDFASPDGSLSVAGGEDVVIAANSEIAQALDAGAPVVYTRDWHPESTPHFEKDGGVWPVHCVQGTPGAAYHPDLELVDGAFEVLKGAGREDGYSGFSERDAGTGESSATQLDEHLKSIGVTSVVVVGLATDYCVRATALDAVRLGYSTTVVKKAVAAVDAAAGDNALAEIAEAGGHLE
ncbi:isochorismatase family protein [Demequina sp. SO4-13]|uniref:isochorismatase family protein n=1 Tax=Demequina sp. SO4-13 TaxID=3401027 RepID=UPI003AF6B35A